MKCEVIMLFSTPKTYIYMVLQSYHSILHPDFAWGFGYEPCATYTGLELKKDGTPTKKESRRQVWQSNVA